MTNHKHEWAVWGDVTWQRCTGCGVGRFSHQHVKALDEEIERLTKERDAAEAVSNVRLTAIADLLRATDDDPDFDDVEARALALIKQAVEEDACGGRRLSGPARMAIEKLDE